MNCMAGNAHEVCDCCKSNLPEFEATKRGYETAHEVMKTERDRARADNTALIAARDAAQIDAGAWKLRAEDLTRQLIELAKAREGPVVYATKEELRDIARRMSEFTRRLNIIIEEHNKLAHHFNGSSMGLKVL